MPRFDSDEVIDYLVLEAVAVKVAQEDEAQRKAAERDHAKKGWESKAQQELEQYR